MVHRVVRHVEVWSVVKVATAFAACGYVIGMISGYLLWRAADRVGTINGIEGFMEDSGGYDTFEIVGDVVFTSAVGVGAVLAVLFVALAAVSALLFNLISDLTGGIRMTAIDEDLIVTPARRPQASRDPRPESASPGPSRDEPVRTAPTAATPAVHAHAPDDRTAPDDADVDEPAETQASPEVVSSPAPSPAHDPWKTPAPNEPWTPAGSPTTNGHAVPTPVGSTRPTEGATDTSRAEPTGPR